MGRIVSAGAAAALALRGGKPIILVSLDQRVPGVVRAIRWASQGDGSADHGYLLGGETWRCDLASIPGFRAALSGWGPGLLDGGQVAIVNPDEDGALWSEILDNGRLDGAEIGFKLVFRSGSETAADAIGLVRAVYDRMDVDMERVSLSWIDAAVRRYRTWPSEVFTLSEHPYAPRGRYGQAKPAVLGNMSGKAFDLATPTTPLWRHVPCPQTSGMENRYFLRDTGTADGQELLVEIGGVPCTVPTASRTYGTDDAGDLYVELSGQELLAWLRPVRAISSSGVTDPAYAMTDEFSEYAVVGSGDSFELAIPGLPSSTFGAYGAGASPAAADVTVYVVGSSASGSASIELTIKDAGSAISGHDANVKTYTTTTSAASETVGDHFTSLEDVANLSVLIVNASGTVYIRRLVVAVKFRSTETVKAWDEMAVYRSQRGFIEGAGLYQDGGYLDPPGTSARTVAPSNPADVVEVILRSKTFGLGLRAPAWTNPSAALTAAIANGTTLAITSGKGCAFAVGDVVVVDDEAMRVASIPPTEAGDGSSQCSGWAFVGMSASNTDAGVLYWSIVTEDALYTVSVYKDSAKTQLVAEGSIGDAAGVVTLAAEGASGLTGSVTIAYTTDDTSGNTLTFSTLVVDRAALGSVMTCHASGVALYIMESGGEVDIASMRGAAGCLKHETGSELLTNGEFEAFGSGLATGWTDADPDSKGTNTAGTGYARRYGQSIERTASGGVDPGVSQAITTVSGTWYRLSGYVKTASGSLTCGVQVDSLPIWTIAATTTWQYFEVEFKATTTSHTVYLRGSTASGTVIWDEVSARALAAWSWDFSVEGGSDGKPTSSRQWLQDACGEALLRLVSDVEGRTSARAFRRHRLPVATWDSTALVGEVEEGGQVRRVRAIRVMESGSDEFRTGVEVRYGWDARRKEWLGQTYVTCKQESTGQSVVGYGVHKVATVADTAGIFPTGRWTCLRYVEVTISGTSVTTSDLGDGLPTFLADGVQAGDWFRCVQQVGIVAHYRLARIAAVTGETTLTLEEPPGDVSGGNGWVTCFPWLLRIGGALALPIVDGGPGTESATTVEIDEIDTMSLGGSVPGRSVPSGAIATGDVIWKMISDSSDGLGVRDQTKVLRSNRERESMRRVATLGQARPLVVEARRVQDRETAIALRDALFDWSDRKTVLEVRTDLSQAAIEPGDVVRITHAIVPGGTMVGEVTEQEMEIESGTFRWKVREL